MSKIGQHHDLALARQTTGPRLMPDLDIASFIGEAAAAEGPPVDAPNAMAQPFDGSSGWVKFPLVAQCGAPEDATTAAAQPWDGSSGWAGGIPRAVS